MVIRRNFYHMMLDVPESVTAPDFYQLLSLDRFEHDESRIREAAIDANQKLLAWQNSEYHEICDRLMDEVVEARNVLVDADQKRDYDEELQRQFDMFWGFETPAVTLVEEGTPLPSLYHVLLGLDADTESPDYYTLIDVPLFESDAEVIRAAILKSKRRLEARGESPSDAFRQEANRLLGELQAVEDILLAEWPKHKYDTWLRRRLGHDPLGEQNLISEFQHPTESLLSSEAEDRQADYDAVAIGFMGMALLFFGLAATVLIADGLRSGAVILFASAAVLFVVAHNIALRH